MCAWMRTKSKSEGPPEVPPEFRQRVAEQFVGDPFEYCFTFMSLKTSSELPKAPVSSCQKLCPSDSRSVLDHRPAFFLACLIPARNPCDTILAYPASLIDAITAAAVPPGVAASCSKSSKREVPARQAVIPSASA